MARKVPFRGAITFEELARQCGLHETVVRRIVRHAIAYHFVFQEPRKGYVAHSAASRRLVDNRDTGNELGAFFAG